MVDTAHVWECLLYKIRNISYYSVVKYKLLYPKADVRSHCVLTSFSRVPLHPNTSTVTSSSAFDLFDYCLGIFSFLYYSLLLLTWRQLKWYLYKSILSAKLVVTPSFTCDYCCRHSTFTPRQSALRLSEWILNFIWLFESSAIKYKFAVVKQSKLCRLVAFLESSHYIHWTFPPNFFFFPSLIFLFQSVNCCIFLIFNCTLNDLLVFRTLCSIFVFIFSSISASQNWGVPACCGDGATFWYCSIGHYDQRSCSRLVAERRQG